MNVMTNEPDFSGYSTEQLAKEAHRIAGMSIDPATKRAVLVMAEGLKRMAMVEAQSCGNFLMSGVGFGKN